MIPVCSVRGSVAYRILVGPLELRCYEPTDAIALRDVTAQNRDHLLPFMPFAADEPQTVDDKLALIRTFRGRFDLGEDFVYGVFLDGALVGGTGLHTRAGRGGLEVGYWIDRAHTRRGFATLATRALTRVAVELMEVERVEIRCEPSNTASMAIPRKLGFTEEGLLRSRLPWPDGTFRDTMSFCLTAEDYHGTPCATVDLSAFDALGRRLA